MRACLVVVYPHTSAPATRPAIDEMMTIVALALDEEGKRRSRRDEGAIEIGVQTLLPALVGHLQRRSHIVAAGRRDEDVETAELPDDQPQSLFHVGGIGGVPADGQAAGRSRHFVQ